MLSQKPRVHCGNGENTVRILQVVIVSVVMLSATTVGGFPVPVSPGKPVKDVTPLEHKLHGAWKGQGVCDGLIIFESNGTYRRMHYGPGNNSNSGKWEVRWDALPPTLILQCKKSDWDQEIGKIFELKIIKLDNSAFSYTFQNEEAPARYLREMK
jgi:hypothetical protein